MVRLDGRRSRFAVTPFTLIVLLSLTSAAIAQPLIVDARYSRAHQAEAAPIEAAIDLLDSHYRTTFDAAATTEGGEFQDRYGEVDWQGWSSHDRSVDQVGDYASIWPNLDEVDRCGTNWSPQVAFVDYGQNGGGGSTDPTWAYGPAGGWVPNLRGKYDEVLGEYVGGELWNEVWSPVLELPAAHNGLTLRFDMYLHSDVGVCGYESWLAQWAGIFAVWHVRSSNDGGNTWSEWRDRDRLFFGGPGYIKFEQVVSDLLLPAATHVQIALGVRQGSRSVYPVDGSLVSPAPYFDNVELLSYPTSGAALTMMETDMARDTLVDPMALSLAAGPSDDRPFVRSYPNGSPVQVRVADGTGPQSAGWPKLHYAIRPNPVYRSGSTAVITGVLSGTPGTGPDMYEFPTTIPDGFYPGEVLHYYIVAADGTMLPSGAHFVYDDFGNIDRLPYDNYDPDFTVRALPSVTAMPGVQAPILLWDDSPHWYRDAWRHQFVVNGWFPTDDWDLLVTKDPTARDFATNVSLNTGLASAVSSGADLDGYRTMVYTSADLRKDTILSSEVALIDTWLRHGNALFACGDNFQSDLHARGSDSWFLRSVLGVDVLDYDFAEQVQGVHSFNVFDDYWMPGTWLSNVNGTCLPAYADPEIFRHWTLPELYREWENTFDVVEARVSDGATRLAAIEWAPSIEPFSAMTRFGPYSGARVVSTPFDLMFDPGEGEDMRPRGSAILEVALLELNETPGSTVGSPVDRRPLLDMGNRPNPFNPSTEIVFRLGAESEVSLRIYDSRGQLVRTLLQGGTQPAGLRRVPWDGRDASSRDVASGVYYYDLSIEGESVARKMLLLK